MFNLNLYLRLKVISKRNCEKGYREIEKLGYRYTSGNITKEEFDRYIIPHLMYIQMYHSKYLNERIYYRRGKWVEIKL